MGSEVMLKGKKIMLKGKRVSLKGLSASDVKELYENAKDREICLYTTLPYPYKYEHAERFVKIARRKLKAGEEYNLGIYLNGSEGKETLIGMMGLMRFKESARQAEIGYWLGKRFWGEGYAGEALELMLEFGFKKLKLLKIYAKVMHPNVASSKLLERNGFTLEGRLRKMIKKNGQWMDDLCYGLLREEWESRQKPKSSVKLLG